jgi:tetratricopeptide (TPR) repeat protein
MTDSAQEIKEEGLRLFQEGLYPEAAAKFEQAHQMFSNDGNQVEAAEMLNNLGVIHRLQQEWDKAIATLEEARETFAKVGDRSREAQTLGNLGGLYASQGEREKARTSLRQAANLFADLGDAQREGETLLALGIQRWKSGERQAALATYEVGLKTLKNPTLVQKIIRWLLSIRSRVWGGGGL